MMISDSLTKPKSAYNYAIVETARLGVYEMKKMWTKNYLAQNLPVITQIV